MSGYFFSMSPKAVPKIKSEHRCIATSIPVPESLPVFSDLNEYESRSYARTIACCMGSRTRISGL